MALETDEQGYNLGVTLSDVSLGELHHLSEFPHL